MLEARGLSKRFGSTLVLDDVAMSVAAGEVRALLGANGSGKSTFIKILAGFHVPEGRPELVVGGRRVDFPMAPQTPREAGLSFVHQDLGLIPSLSVADNLVLSGAAYGRTGRYLRRPRSERAVMKGMLARYGVEIDPWARIDDLSRVDRALVAIVRAVEDLRTRTGAGILVLDEPTASLPEASKNRVAALVREVAQTGSAVIFVSHDLEEVIGLCDAVTVLRDGRVQATERAGDLNVSRLVELIVGSSEPPLVHARREDPNRSKKKRGSERSALRLQQVRGGPLDGVDLEVWPGEIVGLTGLVGSGHDSLPYLSYGALHGASGAIECGGKSFELHRFRPVDAVRCGLALVPADRQEDAVVASLSVSDNMLLPVLREHVRLFVLRGRDLERAAKTLLERFDVRPADPKRIMGQLSGGNQQRVVLAKWANSGARVMLMHEPTQGVDVRAREQIHYLMRTMADAGACFVVASSDHEELASLSDRVIVMQKGKVARELSRDGLTKEKLTQTCLQTEP